jgi:hypothetical protein
MYTLLRNTSMRSLMIMQAPIFLISFFIADRFYSGLHSFAKECLAFLATWFVLDVIVSTVRDFWVRRRSASTP